MLCCVVASMLGGKSALCGVHLLYIILLGSFHWHRKVWCVFEILYLSLLWFSLWSSIECMGNLVGFLVIFGGGLG